MMDNTRTNDDLKKEIQELKNQLQSKKERESLESELADLKEQVKKQNESSVMKGVRQLLGELRSESNKRRKKQVDVEY